MDEINVRYGESLSLPIDTSDTTAVTADIYIGNPGQLYVLTGTATLTDGVGVFNFSQADTRIPLGTYHYQINVTDGSGFVEKYPSPEECCDEDDFPQFVVHEALDETEIS